MTTEWTTLTRKDLSGVHPTMAEIVIEAMNRGGVGRISSKGHAILRAPESNGTMSVPPKVNRGRTLPNCQADFNRLFGGTPLLEKKEVPRTAVAAALVEAAKTIKTTPSVMVKCEVTGCDREFPTAGALYGHVQKNHHPCPEPGCTRAFTSAQGASLHLRRAHKGFTPERKSSVKQETKTENSSSDEVRLLAEVRNLLGITNDDRVAELEKELDEAKARIKKLESKLSVLRDALKD